MKNKWSILLFIGLLPTLVPIGYGIYCAFFGFDFLNHTSYGFQGFFDSVLIIAFLYWPIMLVGVILAIFAIYKLIRLKKSKLQ